MDAHIKSKIISGVLWQGMERFGTQGLQFVVSVILARLLVPEVFGLIAVVLVFLVISDIFIDGGFRNAIIQSQVVSELDLNSIFWCNLFIGIVLYFVMWFAAPWVAIYYGHDELRSILRVLGVIPVIHSSAIVNQALLLKRMKFKRKMKITLGALLLSAPCGIGMAYYGYGVWSLIAMRMVEAAVLAVTTICLVRWFPKWQFSWRSLAKHFKFGGNLLCISLLDQLFINGLQLFTGKFFSLTCLAFYNRGNSYAKLAMNTINNTVSVVMFPTFSQLQDDRAALRQALRQSLRVLLLLEVPLLIGLAVCAKPLVVVLLTEKWSESAYYLAMASIEYLFWPLQVLNIWCILARGDSATALRVEIAKKTVLILALIFSFRYGFKVMIAVWTVCSVLNFCFNSYPNGKALGYGILAQAKDLLPFILVAVAAAGTALTFRYVPCGMWGQLLGRGSIFSCVYLGLIVLFQRGLLKSIFKMLQNYRKKLN